MKHNHLQKTISLMAMGFDYSNPLFNQIKKKAINSINYLYRIEISKKLKTKKISVDSDIVSLYFLINYRTGTSEETLLKELWVYDDNIDSLNEKIKKLNQFLTLIELPIFNVSVKDLIQLQIKSFPQNV